MGRRKSRRRAAAKSQAVNHADIPATTTNGSCSPEDRFAHAFADQHHEERTAVVANHTNGLTHSAAWRGVNYICNMAAKVPCHMMDTSGDGEVKAKDHPTYRLLRREANPYMSAADWVQLNIFNAVWWGEAVNYIERGEDGRPKWYWPLQPRSYAKEVTDDGRLLYHAPIKGERFTFEDDDCFKIFGLSKDGINGVDFIRYIRHTLGHGLTLRAYASRFFSQGANSSGYITIPEGFTKGKVQEFIDMFKKQHTGLGGAHKTMLLFAGMGYESKTIPPEAAQFLETFQLNDKHIANFLNLPGFVVGVEKSVSYNSLEQSRQEVLDSAIDPWLCKIENEHWRKTLTEREKQECSHVVKFNRNALMRVSYKDRIEGQAIQVTHGMITPNANLKANGQPGMGECGDKHMMPMNHEFIEDKCAEGTTPPADEGRAETQNRLATAATTVIANDVGRARRLFVDQVRKMTKAPAKLQAWAEGDEFVRFSNAEGAMEATEILANAVGCDFQARRVVDRWEADAKAVIAELLDSDIEQLKATAEVKLAEGFDAAGYAESLMENTTCKS